MPSPKNHEIFIWGVALYLTGASNLRKCLWDSSARVGQPLDDDAKFEHAGEQ